MPANDDKSYLVTRCPPDETFWQKFLLHLSDSHKHELGFLPRQAYLQAIQLSRVFLCFENGDPCGYLIHGPGRQETKIYQVVVCDDCRRIEHGTALVQATRLVADRASAHKLTCHVAEDLDAVNFWQAIGLRIVGERCKRKDGGRKQFKFEEERPGKIAAAIALKTQLATSRLTNLHRLLTKHNPGIGSVNFQRKLQHTHAIILGDEHGEAPRTTDEPRRPRLLG